MLVCICRKVTDSEVEELSREGLSFSEMLDVTNASSQCGVCLKTLFEIHTNNSPNENPRL
jgi:bacterioferritin-associated ferredoxin